MANLYDFAGADADFFMKSSLNVFSNLNGNRQFVGKTENEKSLDPSLELAEWFDNTGGTQVLYALDIDKFDLSINFAFKQITDPNVLPISWNLDLDRSDANFIYAYGGSSPNQLAEAEWRFVGQSSGSLNITLVIRRGIIIPGGAWDMGAPGGGFTSLPATCRALQDTGITNTARDVFYFIIDRKAYS
jgi:hypothetical protein